jgi:putative methyltransferase (TIGR04325 family)
MFQLLSRVTAKLAPAVTPKLKGYASFAAALADSNSYEDQRLIAVVSEKTRRYREALRNSPSRTIDSRQTVQNMFVLSQVEPQRKIYVLEIGGACGASFYEAKHLLPDRVEHWSIVETAAMAAAGEALKNDPELTFHSDVNSALASLESHDLAIVQGTLQYVPDPPQLLNQLFATDIGYVYVTRTPVTAVTASIFTKQETDLAAHGPGKLPNSPAGKSSQPLTLLNDATLFDAVPAAYEIVFRFEESGHRTLLIDDRAVEVRDVGFLARKRVYSHT